MTRILLIRHGLAQDRQDAIRRGVDDRDRPLTDQGRKRLLKARAGLKKLVPEIPLFATSPLRRSQQTAEILASKFQQSPVKKIQLLAPNENKEALYEWVKRHIDLPSIALVGHEPDLGYFASWLLCGCDRSIMTFKKGSACLIDIGEDSYPGEAKLRWFLTNKQLRKID